MYLGSPKGSINIGSSIHIMVVLLIFPTRFLWSFAWYIDILRIFRTGFFSKIEDYD
jgi:hypothetical protein